MTEPSLVIPDGEWAVDELFIDGDWVTPLEGSTLTLVVAGDRIAGSAGVNRFMGGLANNGFGPLATTMMAGPPQLMDQEQRYLRLLADIVGAEVEGNRLELLGGGVVLIRLRLADSPSGN